MASFFGPRAIEQMRQLWREWSHRPQVRPAPQRWQPQTDLFSCILHENISDLTTYKPASRLGVTADPAWEFVIPGELNTDPLTLDATSANPPEIDEDNSGDYWGLSYAGEAVTTLVDGQQVPFLPGNIDAATLSARLLVAIQTVDPDAVASDFTVWAFPGRYLIKFNPRLVFSPPDEATNKELQLTSSLAFDHGSIDDAYDRPTNWMVTGTMFVKAHHLEGGQTFTAGSFADGDDRLGFPAVLAECREFSPSGSGTSPTPPGGGGTPPGGV